MNVGEVTQVMRSATLVGLHRRLRAIVGRLGLRARHVGFELRLEELERGQHRRRRAERLGRRDERRCSQAVGHQRCQLG